MTNTNTNVRYEDPPCEVTVAMIDVLSRIGDKWTVRVVGALVRGPLRYNQIYKLIEGVSQRMLTLTLKGLERDGLVLRTIYPSVPPRVDYALTDLGHTLTEPLAVLWRWSQVHHFAVLEARSEFDRGRLDIIDS